MIGNSVVPGLPNRWVMPSSLSSARKAERPVMRFFMFPPCRALPARRRHHPDCGGEINGGGSWLHCAVSRIGDACPHMGRLDNEHKICNQSVTRYVQDRSK